MEKGEEKVVKKGTQNTVEEYFAIGEIFTYFFRKKDPNQKPNFNLRMMHGINKISMIVFLLGIIFIIVKKLFVS